MTRLWHHHGTKRPIDNHSHTTNECWYLYNRYLLKFIRFPNSDGIAPVKRLLSKSISPKIWINRQKRERKITKSATNKPLQAQWTGLGCSFCFCAMTCILPTTYLTGTKLPAPMGLGQLGSFLLHRVQLLRKKRKRSMVLEIKQIYLLAREFHVCLALLTQVRNRAQWRR